MGAAKGVVSCSKSCCCVLTRCKVLVSIYGSANISKADLWGAITRKDVTMMRSECLLERTAKVSEKDEMTIRNLRVHAGKDWVCV